MSFVYEEAQAHTNEQQTQYLTGPEMVDSILADEPFSIYPFPLGDMDITERLEELNNFLLANSYSVDSETNEEFFDITLFTENLSKTLASMYENFNFFVQMTSLHQLLQYNNAGAKALVPNADRYRSAFSNVHGLKMMIKAFIQQEIPQFNMAVNSFTIEPILDMYNLLPDHIKAYLANDMQKIFNQVYPNPHYLVNGKSL